MSLTHILFLTAGVVIGLLIGVIRNKPVQDAETAEEIELLKERVSALEDDAEPRRAALDF
jgi:uncharacterized protein YacL